MMSSSAGFDRDSSDTMQRLRAREAAYPSARERGNHQFVVTEFLARANCQRVLAGKPTRVDVQTLDSVDQVACTTSAPAAADEVCGGDPKLRLTSEKHQLGYVMAVARTERIMLPRGPAMVAELAVLVIQRPSSSWMRAIFWASFCASASEFNASSCWWPPALSVRILSAIRSYSPTRSESSMKSCAFLTRMA